MLISFFQTKTSSPHPCVIRHDLIRIFENKVSHCMVWLFTHPISILHTLSRKNELRHTIMVWLLTHPISILHTLSRKNESCHAFIRIVSCCITHGCGDYVFINLSYMWNENKVSHLCNYAREKDGNISAFELIHMCDVWHDSFMKN